MIHGVLCCRKHQRPFFKNFILVLSILSFHLYYMFKHGSLYYTSKIHIHIFMHNVCKNLFKYAQENYKKRKKRIQLRATKNYKESQIRKNEYSCQLYPLHSLSGGQLNNSNQNSRCAYKLARNSKKFNLQKYRSKYTEMQFCSSQDTTENNQQWICCQIISNVALFAKA